MEYHKIETLYERDPKTFKVQAGVFKNRTYTLLKQWRWTEKVDGTNIRIMWRPKSWSVVADCEMEPSLNFGGRSDNAQIHADLYNELTRLFTIPKFEANFSQTEVVLYGEGYGAGIQKCGSGYSATKKFILFDVLVDGKWWLNHENVQDVAQKLGLDVVPDFGLMTLEEATAFVRGGFLSRLGPLPAEGLVGRPEETLFDKKGSRLIVKLKTKDFPA